MGEKIGLVGVGSLGGHVAECLQSHVDTIYAVDPDIVEEKNLRNSIYTKADINKPKVKALKRKITKCKYIPVEADIRNVDLPQVDRIIDCRDVVPRNIMTDVKFLVLGRHLRVDCKNPDLDVMDRNGSYLVELEKPELKRASNLIRNVMTTNLLPVLQEKQLTVHLPISTSCINSEMRSLILRKDSPYAKRNNLELLYEEPISICEYCDIGGA